MNKVLIRPKAMSDLEEQALFIAKDNLQAAYSFYDACGKTFNTLAKMPQSGRRYKTGTNS